MTLRPGFVAVVGDEHLFGAALQAVPFHPPYHNSPASACNSVVVSVVVSSDGTLLASGHAEGSVRIWDVASAKELPACNGHQGYARSVAVSPDGT